MFREKSYENCVLKDDNYRRVWRCPRYPRIRPRRKDPALTITDPQLHVMVWVAISLIDGPL